MPTVARRTKPKPLNPEHDKSSETEPAQQVQNQKDLDSYLALARELGASVVQIKDYYCHLDQLLKSEADLVAARAGVHHNLNLAEDPAILREDLAKVNSELDFAHARIGARQEQITQAENQLHDLLPKARETAQRLFLAFQNHTYIRACARIRELIHFTAHESCNDQINELALQAHDVIETKQYSPPSIPFLVAESLEPRDGLYRPWPMDRKQKMLYVTQLADSLSDCMIQILDRVEELHDFHPPTFLLGAEPPIPETPLNWTTSVPVSYDESLVDQECQWNGSDSFLTPNMEQILKNSGKTKADLTEAYYQVLKHSEKLQRQSAKGGGILFQPNPLAQ
jgi:hypothetical protein